MPVGAAKAGIWKGSGGMSTSDTFNRSNGSLGSTDGGNILAWQSLSGTWSISANRPVTTASRDTNPVAVVDAGSADVDVAMGVSPDGGDALYFRVADANNWLRMRATAYTYSTQYSYQCAYTESYQTSSNYSYQCSYQYSYQTSSNYSYTCYATAYCNVYSSFCDYSPGGSTSPYHDHNSYTCTGYSGEQMGCCKTLTHDHYQTNGQTAVHYHNVSGSTGSAGYSEACGKNSYTCYATSYGTAYATAYTTCYATSYGTAYATAYKTCYGTSYTTVKETVVDRNLGGTVATLATYPDDASSLRAVAVGSTVTPYVNGTAKAALTEANHSTATKHGFGRAPSPNNATALDNFDLTAL